MLTLSTYICLGATALFLTFCLITLCCRSKQTKKGRSRFGDQIPQTGQTIPTTSQAQDDGGDNRYPNEIVDDIKQIDPFGGDINTPKKY